MEKKIYIIPKLKKPIKIIYEELICPVLYNLGIEYRCEYAKSKVADMNFEIYCTKDKCNKINIKC